MARMLAGVMAGALGVVMSLASATLAQMPPPVQRQCRAAQGALALLARDAAAVDALLRHLSAALAAGDDARVVALLAPPGEVEPEFLVEFTNFAKDTKAKTPASFAITRDASRTPERTRTALGRLEVRTPVAMRWRMRHDDPERIVEFLARLIEVEDRWTYAGEVWLRTTRTAPTGGGVEVLYDDASLAAVATMTLDAYEAIQPRIAAGLADMGDDREKLPTPPHVQRIKLYASMTHLQASIYPSYASPLSGWNEPGESIKALITSPRVDGSAMRRMRTLLAHEYTHVRTFLLGPTGNDMPWWVIEGIAELGADAEDAGAWKRCDAKVRAWSKGGRLQAFSDLSDFTTVPVELYAHVYAQGHHMLGFITTRYGRAARNRWLFALANHATLDDATQREFGLSFRELDTMWRAGIAPGQLDAPDAPG